jgi:hypothetical protein
MKNFYCYLFVSIFLLIDSCDINNVNVSGDINIYLLKSFSTESNSNIIIDSTVVLENDPKFLYKDLTAYDSRNHIFKLNNNSISKLRDTWGFAFAVTMNTEIIYTGYFWPGFSSSMCDWIVIDPIFSEINKEMKVRIHYPGESDKWTFSSPDPRNDYRIINIFKRDKKLIK